MFLHRYLQNGDVWKLLITIVISMTSWRSKSLLASNALHPGLLIAKLLWGWQDQAWWFSYKPPETFVKMKIDLLESESQYS